MQKIFSILLCACFLFSKPAFADDVSELRQEVTQLKQMVEQLQKTVVLQQNQITQLTQTPQTQTVVSQLPAPERQPVLQNRSAKGLMNPDIGVVADVVAGFDNAKEDAEGADRVSVREVEFVFGSAVDPYSRLDATVGISDFEGMEIEEAYLTRFDLPFDSTARFGRFLPRIGKSIPYHRDSLDTVDEPFVIQKYFGHHGYNKTGADLTKFLDLPWAMTHQATIGVLEGGNGEEGSLFGDSRREPTIYSSLKNYLELTEATGWEFGVSHLVGSRDDDSSFEVNVIGLDSTLIHQLGDRRHIKLQGEAYNVNRRESFYVFEDPDTAEITDQDLDDARHLWGGYALLDFRFDPKWAVGVRWDSVQLIETADNFANPENTEDGITSYLTFHQSELARWRLQYSHVDLTDGKDDNRVYLQGTFAIGEHKHKIQ